MGRDDDDDDDGDEEDDADELGDFCGHYSTTIDPHRWTPSIPVCINAASNEGRPYLKLHEDPWNYFFVRL